MTQEMFDMIISTLQNWFCGAKLKLNTSKTQFMKIKLEEESSCLLITFLTFWKIKKLRFD